MSVRFRLAVMGILALVGLSASLSAEEPARVREIAAHIQEARAKIGSLSYRVLIEGEGVFGDKGWRRYTSRIEILEKGDLRATAKTNSQMFLDGKTPPQDSATRAVLGKECFAYSYQNSQAVQYLHDSPAHMSQREKSSERSYDGISILDYGFGDGDNSFSAPYLHNPELSRWEVSEVIRPDGGVEYHLKRFAVKEASPQPTLLCVVDPAQGGLITRAVHYTPDGQRYRECKVTCAEVTKGVFLPVAVERNDYSTDATPELLKRLGVKDVSEPIQLLKSAFQDVQVNPEIPDEKFTLEFLQLEDGTMVDQYQRDGSRKLMAYAAGQVRELQDAAKLIKRKP